MSNETVNPIFKGSCITCDIAIDLEQDRIASGHCFECGVKHAAHDHDALSVVCPKCEEVAEYPDCEHCGHNFEGEEK